MTLPTISALPTAPSRTDPATFASRGDAFIAAFATLRTEINSFGAAVDALEYPLAVKRRAISSTDTVIASDRGKRLDLSSTFTLAVTAAATLTDGFNCILYNNGTGVITLDPNASETVDGATTLAIHPGYAYLINCDGSAFYSLKLLGPDLIKRRAISGTDTIVASDLAKTLDLSGTFTLAVTAAATLGNGFWCLLRNHGTGNVTLDPNASETVDGVTSGTIYPSFAFLLQCDGSAFYLTKLDGQRIEVLTAGTSWTAPIGIRTVEVELVGGGGSGAKATSGSNPAEAGSAGGYCMARFNATPGTAYAYAIGAGGASQTSAGSSGNSGNNTTFNTGVVTITGSAGSAGSSAVASANTMAGGLASNGDINVKGGPGFNRSASDSSGGTSQLGQGGASFAGVVEAATGYGSGGAGSQSTINSGDGMNGVIILRY